jgi:PAS domain S-box-containing protein
MLFELWGATAAPRLFLPERPVGIILLLLYLVLFISAFFRYRASLRLLSLHQWLMAGLLAVASVVTSQLFPVSFSPESQLPPISSVQNPVAVMVPFGMVPVLLAAAILNPPAALLVGFSSGLGRALWQSHQVFDPFHLAFAALVAAWLLEQNFTGRGYAWLRRPLIAGPISTLVIVPLTGLAAFFYANPSASGLAALDLALSTMQGHALPLVLEGLIGGLVVTLLQLGLPQLRQKALPLVPSPPNQSLNRRLLTGFLLFTFLLTLALIFLGFNLSIRLSTNLAVQQMARDADTVAFQIPPFRDLRQSLLNQYSQRQELQSTDREQLTTVLEQLFRTGPYYRHVLLANRAGSVMAFYPQDRPSLTLSELERLALANTVETGAPYVSPAQAREAGSFAISFLVPVVDPAGQTTGVLIGRVPDVALNELATGLQGTLGSGIGFIVDERGQIIAHPDTSYLMTSWSSPENQENILETEQARGTAYEGLDSRTNTRQLVYYQTGPDHPWTTIITIPYEGVLGQALRIAAQLGGVLLVAMLLYGAYLLYTGRSITKPLTELVHASQQIAGGSLDTPIESSGDDEIGRLGQAFNQMQVSLKSRLDELSLLLDVSQNVSKSFDINQGMPIIMQGALRGTGAAGIRVVVLNPSGRQPLFFHEGPAGQPMAAFDRQIMSLVRQQQEMRLATPDQVRQQLGKNRDLPFGAMITLPLSTRSRFQGVLWLAYRQAHEFDQTELNFLRTLASHCSFLVENARLYATAEGGRRRLAAVLASTSDAVIVTDQTERILLINPAMERLFKLSAPEVKGRSVVDIIPSEELAAALTSSADRIRNIEIAMPDGRVLYAGVSTIVSNDGQAMGRVAVLHDITYLKELDEMKSEFVATVSHDLRSPLTFMRGYATMLPMMGDLTDKQEDYVEKILSGIEQMSALVNNLLDLGRLDAGIDLVLSRFRMEEILISVAEEYRQPALARGIELVVEPEAGMPSVRGDMSLIRQAVANLVNNAVKYAPNSGRVALAAFRNEQDVVVRVKDNGPGISQKDQMRLYEKFYQVKQRGTASVKGSGLGLALVKSIAERHGGRSWCESEPGQGSTFYISLPLTLGAVDA